MKHDLVEVEIFVGVLGVYGRAYTRAGIYKCGNLVKCGSTRVLTIKTTFRLDITAVTDPGRTRGGYAWLRVRQPPLLRSILVDVWIL